MTEPLPDRPEPVMDAARWASTVASAVGLLAAAFAAYGAITDQTWALGVAAAMSVVASGLAKVLPVMAAQGARAQVTPLAQPVSMDGTPLTPAPMAPRMGEVA